MRLRRVLLASILAAACSGSDSKSSNNGGAPDGGGGPGPDNSGSGTLFLDKSVNAVQPSLARDSSGGLHVAYAGYTAGAEGTKPLRYAHCAAACEKPESWATVDVASLGLGDATWPTLQVDPAGHPRIGWFADEGYRYSACDAGCDQAANWRTAALAQTTSEPYSAGYFALDPKGRPALVYRDYQDGHRGTFMLSCDSGCDASAGWSETLISESEFTDVKLAFAGEGRLRMAFSAETDNGTAVGYAECDGSCGETASWDGVAIAGRGPTGAYALRLDGQGRPRIALYNGYAWDGNQPNAKLLFGRCDADCTQELSWKVIDVGLTEHWGDGGVDLALDAQGRPHVAFNAESETYGIGYVHCVSFCDGVLGGDWQSTFLEKADAVDASDPVPAESSCSLSSWFVGKHPALLLVGAAVRVAYEAEHLQGGSCSAHTDLKMVRMALATP